MEEKAATLREMRICRFCLVEKDSLSNIYEIDSTKNAIPLPLQIMACVTIEVFPSDGMPQLICDDCHLQTRKSYSFKTMCKRSDDALKLYLTTGVLTKQEKEDILESHPKNVKKRLIETEKLPNSPVSKRLKFSDISVQVNMETEPQLEQKTKTSQSAKEVQNESIETTPHVIVNSDLVEGIEYENINYEETSEDVLTANIKLTQLNSKPAKQVATHCFPCPNCERSFPLQQLLDIHMRQHSRERKFSCNNCKKKFFSKHDLAKHFQTHTGEKPFACVVCNKTFSRATLLHRHEKTHISVPKYLCSFCDKTYLTAEDLDTHIETHKRRRPYKCSQCDKSFAFKQGLERHEMTHFSANRHQCNYCEENFTTPGKLARHIQSHAGNRPYPCKLCPRTFLLSHHLTRHLRLHYRNKNKENESGEHKCDYCSMSFRRKDSLINHTTIHSMVNLKCVICNKEFADVSFVKQHVNTHLSGLRYPCDKCVYSFETSEELEDHEAKHIAQEEQELDIEDDEYVNTELENQENENEDVTQNEEELEIDPLINIRRSQRESKVKNYADFLKDELESDSDERINESVEETEPPKLQIGIIPPVIRSETMKVYKGVKEKTNKNKKFNTETEQVLLDSSPIETTKISPPKSITKITTLENLGISKQTLDAMAQKSGIVEMKVGQKILRVQKLMMTKAEYQAMAKKGHMERIGSKVVVQNLGAGLDLNKLVQFSKTLPNLNDESSKVEIEPSMASSVDVQMSKSPVRTYIKKFAKIKDDTYVENTNSKNQVYQTEMSECTIDLNDSINQNDTSLEETEILGNFD